MAREIKGFRLDDTKANVQRQIKTERRERETRIRTTKQRSERQESFIFGSLLNTTTYMIIFLLLIFGLSAEAYQREPQRYSWLDENGEFKTSTYDVTVSYNLDTPLDDLNGYSLREVFEEENQSGFTSVIPVGGTIIHYDGYFTFTGITGNSIQRFINTGFSNLASKTLFTIIDFKITSLTNTLYYFNDRYINTSNTITNFTVGSYQRFYNYAVSPSWLSTNMSFQFVGDTTMQVTADFNNIVVIDLTTLGINQTEEQMKYWYSEYERLQENRINDMKNLGQYAVSSWTTTTEILKSVGEALNSVYETMPVSWLLDWILDLSL
jgi:hypothetical protein